MTDYKNDDILIIARHLSEQGEYYSPQWKQAAEEIERLREQLSTIRRFAMSGEMDTIVEAEIERLREALHDINMLNNANDHGDSPRLHINGIRMIIRDALKEKE